LAFYRTTPISPPNACAALVATIGQFAIRGGIPPQKRRELEFDLAKCLREGELTLKAYEAAMGELNHPMAPPDGPPPP
jgi:hypothetical protein